MYFVEIRNRSMLLFSLLFSLFQACKTSLPLPLHWSAFTKPKKWTVVYICVLGVSILPLSTIFLLDFGTGGIFVFLDFWTVPTAWYFCFSIFLNSSDRVVFLFFYIFELFLQSGIFVFLDFRTVPTEWYFCFSSLRTVPTEWYFCFSRFFNCSDSMVFFY